MKIFIELMWKQSRSCGPNRVFSVGFVGVPPLSQEAISEKSRIGRVQRNLKLGGNTDLYVRPKLIAIINLGPFAV